MPTAKKKPADDADTAEVADVFEPVADEPSPAKAAALEVDAAPQPTGVPDGMVAVEFRGMTLVCPGPDKNAKSFRFRMADGDLAKMTAAILGDNNTRIVAALINDETDDFLSVVNEFFEAYGKATGQGNS